MLITNRQFSGERPKKSVRNIGANEAEVALDCEIVSDDLIPMKSSRKIDVSLVPNTKTIFNLEDVWLSFDKDVDVVRSPVSQAITRIFWTGDGAPKQATLEDFQNGIVFNLGVPKPSESPGIIVLNTPATDSNADVISTFAIYTFVNAYGEEGDRSAPSQSVTYQIGDTILLSPRFDSTDSEIEEHNVVAVRYYLFDPDADAVRFVSEHSVADGTIEVDTSEPFLNELFSTDDFDVPPADLEGLHVMANQIMIGFKGRTVYLTEPGQPSAWRFFFPVSDDIVAISSFDNNAVILTEGYPEIATIFDPRNISTTILADREPCVSSRSVVQGLGGVIYAAPSGTYFIGASGGRMLTNDYYDDRDWNDTRPDTHLSVFRDGEYISFHESNAKEGSAIVFDTRESNAIVRQLSQRADAAFVLTGTDDLYVAVNDELFFVNGGSDDLIYLWRSKMHGGGSPFALTSRRLISCDFLDNLKPAARAKLEALIAENLASRIASIQERAAAGPILGYGGALNQNTLAGCGPLGFGLDPSLDRGAPLGGGSDGVGPFIPAEKYADLTVYGDKEIVHEERVNNDTVGRLKYTQRKRLWQYQLRGNAELSQFDMAGSNSEMHNGS